MEQLTITYDDFARVNRLQRRFARTIGVGDVFSTCFITSQGIVNESYFVKVSKRDFLQVSNFRGSRCVIKLDDFATNALLKAKVAFQEFTRPRPTSIPDGYYIINNSPTILTTNEKLKEVFV